MEKTFKINDLIITIKKETGTISPLLINQLKNTIQGQLKFSKEKTPSVQLAKIVGKNPLPRTEVVKKMWAYIKKNGLQDPNDKTIILTDSKLKAVFNTKYISMFKMNSILSEHLT